MESTSVSLLNRLRQPHSDMAWQRFVDLYAPLIFHWARKRGLPVNDAADLVQDVLADLIVDLREFRYDPSQRFRGWLYTIVNHRASNLRRRLELAPQSIDGSLLSLMPSDDDADQLFSEAEYRCQIALRAFELLQDEFEASTWQAAWLQIAKNQPASVVAREFGMTINAVYIAKSRVLRRLRQELKGLVD